MKTIVLPAEDCVSAAAERLIRQLEKKKDSKYQYIGDYMNQYSWPEYFHAELDEISYAMEDE